MKQVNTFNVMLYKRFVFLSLVITGLLIAFDSMSVKLICFCLAAVTFLISTRSGLALCGHFFHIKSLLGIPAPQKTLLFRIYTGFPLAAVLFLIAGTGYYQQISQALTGFFFFDEKMSWLKEQSYHYLPSVTYAVTVYAGMMLIWGSVITYFQTGITRKKLNEIRNSADARRILNAMSWDDFEKLVCQFFISKGYKSYLTRQGADGGIDIEIEGKNGREIVQCKHWKNQLVGVAVVREIFGVLSSSAKYSRGFVVISGRFSQDAVDFVKKEKVHKKIVLIDGDMLTGLIKGTH